MWKQRSCALSVFVVLGSLIFRNRQVYYNDPFEMYRKRYTKRILLLATSHRGIQ